MTSLFIVPAKSAQWSFRSLVTGSLVAIIALFATSACTIGDVDQVKSSASQSRASAASSASTKAPRHSMGEDNTGEDSATPKTNGHLKSLVGTTISIDPGHAGTPPPASQMVTDGRGGMKQCNTTGTASNDGWAEHTFNWELTMRMQRLLEEAGATVLLSRADDQNRAACIDKRARDENASGADAVVSIHADGAAPSAQGFHISYIADPLPGNLPEESRQLATDIRDSMTAAGFRQSNYLGTEGLWPRADLTGLNLSTRPKVLVECGNMRNEQDAELLRSAEGQQRLADAIVTGIAAYLENSK